MADGSEVYRLVWIDSDMSHTLSERQSISNADSFRIISRFEDNRVRAFYGISIIKKIRSLHGFKWEKGVDTRSE